MQTELTEILHEIKIVLNENAKVNNELLQFLHSNKPQIKRITLTDYHSKYIDLQKENLSVSSFEILKYAINHFKEFLNGKDIYLDEISTEMVLEFRNYLFGKAKSKVYWRSLKAFFTTAVKLNYLNESRFNIDYIKTQQIKKDAITTAELYKIITYIKSNTIKLMVEFNFLTGLRLGEIVGLRLSDINFTEKILTVGSELLTTKSKKQRIVPLTDRAFEIVQIRFPKLINFDKSNYIFGKSNNVAYSKDYISKSFKKAIHQAGLGDKRITYHSLRHSFAFQLALNGTPINTIKELLGHSSVKVTEIYFDHENLQSLKKGIGNIN